MTYKPQINDYVIWTNELGHTTKGWVVFVDDVYISIEIAVKDKKFCELTQHNAEMHKKDHLLVVCYAYYWDQLQCAGSRKSIYDNRTPV